MESLPLFRAHRLAHLIQVVLVAGGQVVQPYDDLIQPEEFFEEVAADESGNAGYQPFFRLAPELLSRLFDPHCLTAHGLHAKMVAADFTSSFAGCF
jgi:hypothetical protein